MSECQSLLCQLLSLPSHERTCVSSPGSSLFLCSSPSVGLGAGRAPHTRRRLPDQCPRTDRQKSLTILRPPFKASTNIWRFCCKTKAGSPSVSLTNVFFPWVPSSVWFGSMPDVVCAGGHEGDKTKRDSPTSRRDLNKIEFSFFLME